MFKCLNCGNEFNENESNIIRYGTGAISSSVELFSCPKCESTSLKDEDGKIQSK